MPLHFLSGWLSAPARTKLQRRQLALGNTVIFLRSLQVSGLARGTDSQKVGLNRVCEFIKPAREDQSHFNGTLRCAFTQECFEGRLSHLNELTDICLHRTERE